MVKGHHSYMVLFVQPKFFWLFIHELGVFHMLIIPSETRLETRQIEFRGLWAMGYAWQTLLECELYLQSTLRSGYQTWCADLPPGYLPLHQHRWGTGLLLAGSWVSDDPACVARHTSGA